MDHRHPLLILALAALLVVAGCSAADEGANASPTESAPTEQSTTGPATTSTTSAITTPAVTGTPTPSTTATPTPTSTASPTPTATATSTPTPTSSPTPTATPSPTPTATSTPTPRPERGPEQGTEWRVTVTRVVDGDTIEVRFPNGEIDTLRLLGVDTPETTLSRTDPAEFEGIPESPAGKDHLYEWGQKAETFATNRLDGQTVRIAVDPEADRRGSFGRLLTYVYYDGGTNFNKQLLDEGYARMYDSTFSKREAFADAEARAQSNDVGLWAFEGGPTATVTPTDTPTPDEGGGDGGSGATPTPPVDGDYDCSHFDSQSQAQQVYDASQDDEYRLDSDNDGEACESLD